MTKLLRLIPAALFMMLTSACGMGGSNLNDSGNRYTVTGTVSSALVPSGNVIAYKIIDGIKSDPVGSASIDSNGNFSFSSPYSGPMLFEASQDFNDSSKPVIHSAVTELFSGVAITPLTELAWQMAPSLSTENIDNKSSLIENIFKLQSITSTLPPIFNKNSDFTGKSSDQVEYAAIIAALDEMAKSSNKSEKEIIDDLKIALNGDVMSAPMASELQKSLRAVGADTSVYSDLGRIGTKKIGITFEIVNSAKPHSGIQFTIKLPDNTWISGTSVDNNTPISQDYYSILVNASTPGNTSPLVLDKINNTLTLLIGFNEQVTIGQIITIYFDVPAEAAAPSSLAYNGLLISISSNSSNSADSVAFLKAYTSDNASEITLTSDATIPIPGGP